MMYCKSKFGENDHRCPSNWAQGHAHSPDLDQEKGKKESDTKYGAFTFYYSQLQIQRQSRIPFQDKSLLLITQSLTLVRAGARDMFLLSTHPALPSEGGLGLKLVPRLWYGALRVRPVDEPWFTGTGRLVALAITFSTSASSLDAASFINTCWRHGLFANGRPCETLLYFFSFMTLATSSRAAIAAYGSKRAAGRAITIWRVDKADSIGDASIFSFHSSNSFFSAPTVVAEI